MTAKPDPHETTLRYILGKSWHATSFVRRDALKRALREARAAAFGECATIAESGASYDLDACCDCVDRGNDQARRGIAAAIRAAKETNGP